MEALQDLNDLREFVRAYFVDSEIRDRLVNLLSNVIDVRKALSVMVLNKEIHAWLKANDPKALEQAEQALAR